MLTITIEPSELFDESNKRFIPIPGLVFELEHSLISVSKWESIHQKPFLATNDKTNKELLDYVKMMIITPNVSDDVIFRLTQSNIDRIQSYINSKQSATTFGEMPETKGRGETITSELIYYWMVSFRIPFECQDWHINRLFSLIRICNIKNSKQKKLPRGQAAAQRRAENLRRREALNSRG